MRYLNMLGLMASLLFASCESFLDRNPSTSLPSNEAVTTVKDLNFAVNGVYSLMTDTRGTYAGDFIIFADLRGNDLTPWDNNGQISPVAFYTVDKNNTIALDFYRQFYKGLARVNKVLSQATEIEVSSSDEATYNNLIGELYAVRALYHFDLSRLFAKVPTNSSVDINAANSGIVLSNKVYEPSYLGSRSTLKETYDFILSDLAEAAKVIKKTKNTGHLNYWAVKALEARVNLYYGKYQAALTAAEEVIKDCPYTLYERNDYTSVWEKEGTSESMLEILVTDIYSAQRNSVGYYTHVDGYAECAAGDDFVAFLNGRAGDVRSQLIEEESDGTDSGMFIQKYPGRNGNRYLNNPKLIRLSEVYLIAAEAAVKGATGTHDAVYYMNALRAKRIEGYVDVAAVTLDDVLTERRLELFGEGHYAWDYWRNNKDIVNDYIIGGIVAFDNYMTILPIPQTEIEVSKGSLVQNPQY